MSYGVLDRKSLMDREYKNKSECGKYLKFNVGTADCMVAFVLR